MLLQVRGAVEILRNFFASLAASFSGMCSSLPALGHILGATLVGFQLAFEQVRNALDLDTREISPLTSDPCCLFV